VLFALVIVAPLRADPPDVNGVVKWANQERQTIVVAVGGAELPPIRIGQGGVPLLKKEGGERPVGTDLVGKSVVVRYTTDGKRPVVREVQLK
jgi:hypothetical protein